MREVMSVRDIEELIRRGENVRSLPEDALLTPSARDFLRDLEGNGVYKVTDSSNGTPIAAAAPKNITTKSSKADIDAFFRCADIHKLKEEICDVGKRLWQRAYVDGNGGNIAIRVSDELVLCTPTLVSKGFMKPEDICFVDLEGNQFCGPKKRTSEI